MCDIVLQACSLCLADVANVHVWYVVWHGADHGVPERETEGRSGVGGGAFRGERGGDHPAGRRGGGGGYRRPPRGGRASRSSPAATLGSPNASTKRSPASASDDPARYQRPARLDRCRPAAARDVAPAMATIAPLSSSRRSSWRRSTTSSGTGRAGPLAERFSEKSKEERSSCRHSTPPTSARPCASSSATGTSASVSPTPHSWSSPNAIERFPCSPSTSAISAPCAAIAACPSS